MTISTSRRRVRGRVAATSVTILVCVLASACSSAPEVAPTQRVTRGTVATKVSAAGALTAITSQNLGFPKGAQLAELHVKVGDRVQPGQVLAKLDTFAFQQALAQQQAMLNQQQAQLDKIVNGTAVTGAKATLEQARRILSATEKNVDAQKDANSDATRRAEVQRDFDRAQVDKARQQVAAACASGSGSGFGSSSGTGSPTGFGPATGFGASDGSTGSTGSSRQARDRDRRGDSGDSTNPSGAAPTTVPTTPAPTPTSTGGSTNSTCLSATANVTAAQRQALGSQTEYVAAKNKEDVDATTGRVSIENARQSVVSAQNDVDSSSTDRPSDIAGQSAVVTSARAAVALAQRDLDNTVLRAPVAGTVSAVNGAVGEFVGSASSGTTPLAPGTSASIPGVGAQAASDSSGGAGAGPSATRPGGAAFLVLNDVNTFQVVVPFEESDAAKIAVNQRVDVTFDALPDLIRHGTVLSVAPSGTNISGVTNYYATILLTDPDPRLRSGQTAQAGVLVNAVDNVLVVPNAAVIRQGDRTLVNTPGPDGAPVRVPFQAGAVGNESTQVVSGLREGQPILTPPVPAQGGGR